MERLDRDGRLAPLPQFPRTRIALALAASLAPALAQALPGDRQGGEVRINGYVSGDQTLSQVAMDAVGNHVIIWESDGQDGSSIGIYGQRFDAAGAPRGGVFRVNTITSNSQQYPQVAMDGDGDFVVVWQSRYSDGDGWGVYAQRYGRDGTPQGGEIAVNQATSGQQSGPDVAMDEAGNFIVTWVDSAALAIEARRYAADGSPLGNQFPLVTPTANGYSARVAMDAVGNFVLVYGDNDGDGVGVIAQRFDRDAFGLGPQIRVNTTTSSSQTNPDVAMDDDGDMVIVWQSYHQGTDTYGTYLQRYSKTGAPLGVETKVHTSNPYAIAPAVACDADGDFVVAWTTASADTTVIDIAARRFNRLGVPLGAQFRVNTATSQNQLYPAVALDAHGDFTIAWHSQGQDGSGYGVYAQRYRGYDTFARPAPDLNGNLTPEVIGAEWNGTGWIARVRDGYTGTVLGSVTFSSAYDVADIAFAGTAGNPRIAAALAKRGAPGTGRLELRALNNASTVVDGFKRPLRLLEVPDVDGNGFDDVALFDLDPATQAVTARVRDGNTLASISTLGFGTQYTLVDVAVVPDVTGNGKSEVALLGRSASSGAVRVESRDAVSGALVNDTTFNPDLYPYRLGVAPDMSGNAKPELVVVGVDDVYQQATAQVLDAVSDRIVRLVQFGSYAPVLGLGVLPDQSGNGKPELAILQQDPVSGRPVVEMRDASSKALLRSIPYTAGYAGQALLTLDDFDGGGKLELAVQMQGQSSGVERVQIRDSGDGSLIRTAPLP